MVEWFFNYSTRRQTIVFLNSPFVLVDGNLLEFGQLFSGEILWWGTILLGATFPWAQLSSRAIVWGQFSSGAIILAGNCLGDQLSGGQFSSGAVVLKSFASINKILIFTGRLGTRLSFYGVLTLCWYLLIF